LAISISPLLYPRLTAHWIFLFYNINPVISTIACWS